MPTRREQIQSKAIEILESNPQGVRYSQLVNMIKEALPVMPINTIHGNIWNLDARFQSEVYKADRGLFRHTSFRESTSPPTPPETSEESFYQPFADYLVNEF